MPNQPIDELLCGMCNFCKVLSRSDICVTRNNFKLSLYKLLKEGLPRKKKVDGEPCPCGDIDCRIDDEENSGYNQALDDIDASLKKEMGL